MGYTRNDEQTRKCTRCNSIFPNTKECFGMRHDKNGNEKLEAVCKECKKIMGKERREKIKEKNKNLSLFYDGTRKCKKCQRDLPNNKLYFSIDYSCKDGLRSVCRECSQKESGFLEENYVVSQKWTPEEIELLKNNYSLYDNVTLQRDFFPNRTIRAINSQANVLGFAGKCEDVRNEIYSKLHTISSQKLKGRVFSDESKKRMSDSMKKHYETHTSYWKGRKRSPEQCKQMSERAKGRWTGDKNPRHINPLTGSNNGRWAGGLTDTYQELRSELKDWQQGSMEFCNYSCVLTGVNLDEIHHTTSFKELVAICFDRCNLEVKPQVSDYDNYDIQLLKNTIRQLHIEYGYGACLCKEIHKLFHDTYGYHEATPENFLDFVTEIKNGKYDDWFYENNYVKNINYKYVNYLKGLLSTRKE